MPKRKTVKKRTAKKTKSRFFIPFPLILFVLLCVGAYLFNATYKARAAQDIQVTAAIKGPPVTTPATITTPADGTHFSAVPLNVVGDCPANAEYLELFRNNIMSGSTICDNNSKFSADIDLFAGQNYITAHSFNINDNEGPISHVLGLYYDAPTGSPGSPASGQTGDKSSGGSSPTETINPLILKTVFVYKGYYVDQEVEWPLEISGGTKPYAFNIDWGDGSNSVISRKSDGPFNIKHKYKKPGGNKGAYKIKVQASDSEERYAYIEFFVIVSNRATDATASSIYNKTPPTLGNLKTWLWWAWPVYSLVFLMAISYKLGEREEYKILKRRGLLRH